jgi:hypothetical protein
MVSLSAGLVVALGIFALARGANATFHSEQRVATAEMSLRSAMERLRADIGRASFMSTGNIRHDPTVAVPLTGGLTIGRAGVDGLGSFRLERGGSLASSSPLFVVNRLAPDLLDIGGNFTTSDEFVVRLVEERASCTRLWLMADSPAMWRLRAGASGGAAATDGGVGASTAEQDTLRAAFQPVPLRQADGTADPDADKPFIVRIADGTGKYQYRPTCTAQWAASFESGQPYVDVAGTLTLGSATGASGGVTGLGVGRMSVNPVQIVRWQVASVAAIYAAHGRSLEGVASRRLTTDATEFVLARSWVSADRELVGPPEIVAEYAVDFKVGFTVDPSTDTTGATPGFMPLGIGSVDNELYAYDLQSTQTPLRGPQRVRSVRFRVSTRSQLAEGSGYVGTADASATYSFCMNGSAATLESCRQFARMRTLTSEVAVPNQARFFY